MPKTMLASRGLFLLASCLLATCFISHVDAAYLDDEYLTDADFDLGVFEERSLFDSRTFNISFDGLFNSSSILGIGAAIIIGIILFGK